MYMAIVWQIAKFVNRLIYLSSVHERSNSYARGLSHGPASTPSPASIGPVIPFHLLEHQRLLKSPP